MKTVDGHSIPTGFYGTNAPDINALINKISFPVFAKQLRDYISLIEDTSIHGLTKGQHQQIIKSIENSWKTGMTTLITYGVTPPITLHIQNVNNMRGIVGKKRFEEMDTAHEMIDALEEHYNSKEMKFEALRNFQNCVCGNDESLSVFLSRYVHLMMEQELVSKQILSDEQKRDTLLRSIKNTPRHIATYDQVAQAHSTFKGTMAYLMGKAMEETTSYAPYSEVTKTFTQKTTPVTARLGTRPNQDPVANTKPPHLNHETKNVFHFRAIHNLCTRCGLSGHFKIPRKDGTGERCKLHDTDHSRMMPQTSDTLAGYKYYTKEINYQAEYLAKYQNRDKGTQGVASQSRLVAASPSFQSKLNPGQQSLKNLAALDLETTED